MTEPARPDSPEHEPTDAAEHDGGDPLIRWFVAGGERWGVWIGGAGNAGTGELARGILEAVHFCKADAPEETVCRTYLARGRLHHLFDDELCTLLARALPIPDEPPGSGPGDGPRGRRR